MNRGIALPVQSRRSARWAGPLLPDRLNHTSRLALDLDFATPRGRILLNAFSSVNWSGFTETDIDRTVPGAYYLDHPGSASTTHRARLLPLPTGDFDAVLHTCMYERVNDGMGIFITSGVTAGAGTQTGLFPSYLTGGLRRSTGANYTNFTTFSSTQWTEYGSDHPAPFIRARRVGAAYSVALSYDGRIWSPFATVTPSGPNYIGFGFFTTASASRRMAVKSFRIWQPAMPDDALGVYLPPFNTEHFR